MSDKLKPCPFCGGKAEIIERFNSFARVNFYNIGCTDNALCIAWICTDKNCNCQDGYSIKSEAISAWNRRSY